MRLEVLDLEMVGAAHAAHRWRAAPIMRIRHDSKIVVLLAHREMGEPSEHTVLGLEKTKWEETQMQDRESKRSRVNRREFVKGAAALGAGAMAFPWQLAWAQDVPNEFDGSKFQLKAPEPNPKSGGVLNTPSPRPPHFDMHQSGTINSLGQQAACSTT
jgi:hypothetical protein